MRSFRPILLCVLAFMACGPQHGGAQKPGDKMPAGTAMQADAESEPEQETELELDTAAQESAVPDFAADAKLVTETTTPAGKPPVAGGAQDEEEVIRETTLADLLKEDEKPGLVKVKAYFIEDYNPGPCPPHAKCEPCASLTIISEDPSSTLYDSIWVEGYVPKAKKLKKGKAYTFVLQLKEGYKAGLDTHSCDPRLLKISMYDCLDCPGKGKTGKGKK